MAIGKSLRSGFMGDGAMGSGGDPMESMGNLMDVMLVFACGLMIALIARYNVDLTQSTQDVRGMEPVEAEVGVAQESMESSDSHYAEVGVMYRDVDTGELYVVEGDGE